MNACGDSRLRGLRSRKPIGFRQWVVHRDLTQSEIQAYQELTTYAGTTIVENDADCYMEVSAGGGDTLRAKKLALLLGD